MRGFLALLLLVAVLIIWAIATVRRTFVWSRLVAWKPQVIQVPRPEPAVWIRTPLQTNPRRLAYKRTAAAAV